MIEVRTPTEAAAYALLNGHTVLERRRPRPQVEVWTCATLDQITDLTFVIRPGAEGVVRPEQFEQVGRQLLAALPDGPEGFVRGAVRAMFDDALLAGACLEAAAPTADVQALQALASTRRARMAAGLASAPDAGTLEALPVPAHGFVPQEAEARWIAHAAPLPVGALPAPWQVVARATDGRFLLRHPAHALAWATLDDARRQVVRLDGLTGAEALRALVTYGFRFEEVQKARLRAACAGATLEAALERGLAGGRSHPLMAVRHPTHRVCIVEVESPIPRYKACLAAFLVDDADRVLGVRFIDGLDGYAMLLRAEAVAPTLPDARGGAPDATRAAEADAHVQRIAAAVLPVITTMLQGPEGVEAVRPHPGDAAYVFEPAEAEKAASRYAALWAEDPPRLPRPAAPIALELGVSPAGFFGTGNPLTAPFPEGYANIAPRLNPHAVWVCWSYVEAGRRAHGDGLVWVPNGAGGRWVWFPKPWRVLA